MNTVDISDINRSNSDQDRLMALFGQLASLVVLSGLDYARRDDPNAYARSLKLLQSKEATVQIRVDVEPELRTGVWLLDRAGEPIAEICSILGRLPAASEIN